MIKMGRTYVVSTDPAPPPKAPLGFARSDAPRPPADDRPKAPLGFRPPARKDGFS